MSFAGGSPAVQAIGGSAELQIIACPTPAGIAQIRELFTVLSAASVIVSAREAGSAKLLLDLCPGGMPPRGPL